MTTAYCHYTELLENKSMRELSRGYTVAFHNAIKTCDPDLLQVAIWGVSRPRRNASVETLIMREKKILRGYRIMASSSK